MIQGLMHVKILSYREEPYASSSGWNTLGKLEIAITLAVGELIVREVAVKKRDERIFFAFPSKKINDRYVDIVELPPEAKREFNDKLATEWARYNSRTTTSILFPDPSPDEPHEGIGSMAHIPYEHKPKDEVAKRVSSMSDFSMDMECPF